MKASFLGVAMTAAYWLAAGATPAVGAELVTNGDFSAGATGFQSTFTSDGSGAGRIQITTNPRDVYGAFDSFGDHTTGTGNMLFADPNAGGSTYFWQQTFGVVANSTYAVSYWARQAAGGSEATIAAQINGVSLGANLTPARGSWSQFTATYNSGLNTSVTFSLFDTNTTNIYNDFLIDDISFVGDAPAVSSAVPEPATWAMMIVGFGAIGGSLRRRARTAVRFA